MYLFLSDKNNENKSFSWDKIKYNSKDEYQDLINSLSAYITGGGKKDFEEKLAVAELLYNAAIYLKKRGVIEKVGALKKGNHGKPYLEGGDAKISISHSDGAVAIAFSKAREVGVDIEEKIAPCRAERLEKRFFAEFELSKKTLENNSSSEKIVRESIEIYNLENGEFKTERLLPTDGSFTSKWTACEAIMKCDGRGFSALCDIGALAEKMEITSFVRERDGQKTYISIALE